MDKNLRPLEVDERIFTLRDCLDLLRRKWKWIVRSALIGAFFMFGSLILKSSRYVCVATFKEGGESEARGVSLNDMLGGLGGKSESKLMVYFKSQPVLKPLVQKMGLQARVKTEGRLVRYYRRIRDNFRSNASKLLQEADPFVFLDLVYEGEGGLSYFLCFSDETHFSLLDPSGKLVAESTLGQEIALPHLTMTLIKAPRQLRYRHRYPLTIAPWFDAVNEVSSHLQISPHKLHKTFFEFSFSYPDRHRGVEIVNAWMEEYRKYLKQNHDEVVQEQMAYLESRHDQLYDSLSIAFDQYAKQLSENLKTRGCIGVQEEMDQMLGPLHELSRKMLTIHIELSRFDQMEKGTQPLMLSNEGGIGPELAKISSEIQTLKQQRDLLLLSVPPSTVMAAQRIENLKEIRQRKEALEILQSQVESKSPLSVDLAFEADRALAHWAAALKSDETERRDFAHSLEQYIRILGMQESLLQDQLFRKDASSEELEGIDIDTARALVVDYHRRLSESESTIRHLELLRSELDQDDFEFHSLSAVLTDLTSQALIQRASQTMMKCKDEAHRSAKEEERWKGELAIQKKILGEHLMQLTKVEEVNSSLIQEKIAALKQATLDCISQQISALQSKGADLIKERRSSLLKEQELLREKMEQLKLEAAEIPQCWRQEKWLDMKVKFSAKLMEVLTELIETNTIGHNLYRVESKLLNVPIAPLLATCPRLYSKSALGAALGAFACCFCMLLSAIFRGFPSSYDKLKAMRFPLLGTLSSFSDGADLDALSVADLELLRRLVYFIKSSSHPHLVGLIAGQGPDYSFALAENLSKTSLRSLVLRCDFSRKYHQSSVPGLLQYLEGESLQLPIREGKGFDFVTSGGYSPYGNEWLQSKRFQELLEQVKPQYDCVLLLFRSELAAAESTTALSLCQQAIITVCHEPTPWLAPFFQRGATQFITSSKI
ncbi:MAG: hypothetical protein HY069_03700 [Chlamydiia bacterium]|nr:hypothetical protein [Chlamydiia bacterium]